jgi:hypothetical protein
LKRVKRSQSPKKPIKKILKSPKKPNKKSLKKLRTKSLL